MKKLLTKFPALILMLMLAATVAYASDIDEARLRKELPRLLGSSNQGTEFFMTFHPCWEAAGKPDGCKIYITSAVATLVRVTIPGKGIDTTRMTKPNDIIEFNFGPDIAQCYRKTDKQPPQPQKVFKGYGIIVTAEDPIVCYGVTRYEQTSDGYLAIPKNGLGKNYVVSSYNDPCSIQLDQQYLTSYTSIVGVYNKTKVKVKLGGEATNYTPGADRLETGDVTSETINRGDVWLIGVMGEYGDLTGTTVEADKVVSVISGSFCAYVPVKVMACDFLIEQDLPMESWGYKYHATQIINRKKASYIRVFASEPNTAVYRDGNEWFLVRSVGGEAGQGYQERRAVADGDMLHPVVISAKSRIAVTQYNCGQDDDKVQSDPFQLSLTPIEQYQTGFVWCTPGVNGGSSFKENYLNLCYKSTEEGQIPDDVEFGQVNSGGVVMWRKLNSFATDPGLTFIDPTESDPRKYRSLTIVLPDPSGVYSLRANDGMAGYGYGYDWCDSYGYPVSVALADLSKPDIWAPTPTYAMNCKGEVEGHVIEQPENDETLRSNMADLQLVKSESFNFTDIVYDEVNFEPGTTYIMDWSIKVIDVEADAKAVLMFMDRAGNDTTITIEYQRVKFSIKNRIENWGLKAYNDPPETRTFKLLNESGKPVTVDTILLLSQEKGRNWPFNGFTLDPSIYKANGGKLPGYTMQPGEELSFKVTFDPQSVASDILAGKSQFLDSIGVKAYWSDGIDDYCYFKYRAVVKSQTGSPCISVDRLDFGKITVNTTKVLSISIFNHGTADLTITGYSLPAGAPNNIYVTNGLGIISVANPVTIPIGGKKIFSVTFKPNAVKLFPDQIIFESDADTTCTDHDPICELTGEGIIPGIELDGFDWNKRRVHLNAYNQPGNPYGKSTFPYSTLVDGGTVTKMTIKNTGTQDFTITSAQIKNEVHPEYFIMDFNSDGTMDGPLANNLNSFVGLKISPNQVYTYPVFYDPLTEGDHTVTVVVKGEKDGYPVEGECTFLGTGYYPKGTTFDYMFTDTLPNQTAIVDLAHPGYDVTVKFTADNWGDFADPVKIYEVKLVTAEGKAISKDITKAGDSLFAFDYQAVNDQMPFFVQPGSSFSFPAKYYPYKSSPNLGKDPFVAHVIFVTDADVAEHTSEWTGKSVTQGVTATGFKINTCIKYEESGIATITNTADAEVQISNMFIRPISGDATALTIFDNQPFKLAAGESKDIQVLFKQDGVGVTFADIVFITSVTTAPEITARITCEAFSYPRMTSGKINGGLHQTNSPYEIGFSKSPTGQATNMFNYSVEIEDISGDMVEVNKETSFYVDIIYNRNFLGAEFDDVKKQIKAELGSGLNSADYVIEEVKEEKIDTTNTKIKITIRNVSGNPVTTKGTIEIVKLNFIVFLNEYTMNLKSEEERKTLITQTVSTNEACVPLTVNNNPYARLEEVCVQNLRLIEVHESQFSINTIVPNPIGVKGGDISYNLGFDCTAEMTIFNSAGSAVAKPVNMKQTAGAHTVAVPIDELASGVYFIELKAGPYIGTTRLVISK